MARLPTVGGDTGSWGTVLNEYLAAGHDAEGNNIGKIVEISKTSGYTLAPTDNGKRLVATSALTLTVPSAATLGNGFECEIINDSGGSVIIDGTGSTNVTLADGEVGCILIANSKQRVIKGASTIIS